MCLDELERLQDNNDRPRKVSDEEINQPIEGKKRVGTKPRGRDLSDKERLGVERRERTNRGVTTRGTVGTSYCESCRLLFVEKSTKRKVSDFRETSVLGTE